MSWCLPHFVFLFSAHGLELSSKNLLDLLKCNVGAVSYDICTSVPFSLETHPQRQNQGLWSVSWFSLVITGMHRRLATNPQADALTGFLFCQGSLRLKMDDSQSCQEASAVQNAKGATARWVNWQCTSRQDRVVR